MKNIKEMNIPELEKTITRTYRDMERLERQRDRLENMLNKRRLERYHYKDNEIIVGKAKVFNRTRLIIAQIAHLQEHYNYDTKRNFIQVTAYTPGDRKYEFDVRKIRRAKPKEVEEFKLRYKKWIGK